MGEVHDFERFYAAKCADLGLKVSPDSALELIGQMQGEYVRQFQVRWAINMELADGIFRPAAAADAEKLRQLRETDERTRMFDPRVLGEMVQGR